VRVVLLRVGIDTGEGGISGPLFADGRFEFVPIPDARGLDTRTYGNTLGRHGRLLAEYFPPARRAVRAAQAMHVDPEFDTFTYGDPTHPKRGLRNLQAGDLLVFSAGLQRWPADGTRGALYIIGYFEVAFAGLASSLSEAQLAMCAANFHVRHPSLFEVQRDRLVLVKGARGSRLLDRAVLVSEPGVDRSGRPLHVISSEMRAIFGDFDGRVSIQRSPPRRVAPVFSARAAAFVRSLACT
jgi:hypothetical protein